MRRSAPLGVSQRTLSPREGHDGVQCSPSTSPHLSPESRLLVPPQQKNVRGAASSSRGFPKKTSVDLSGGSPPLYALASGALYGSTTSSPKYVLTQIALLQSGFYLVYALLSLVALTFLIDLGDEASSLPSAGDGLLLVLEGDVAPRSSSGGQHSLFIRSSSLGFASAPTEGSANSADEKVQPFLPRLQPPETSRETDLSPMETRNEEVQNAGKQSDSARQQDRLPGREQAMESKRKRGYKGLRRSHVLFETKLYSFLTKEGRVLLLVFFLTSLAMSYLVFLVVERARKCLDFCFSIHFLHFLACWALSGFPHQRKLHAIERRGTS
ncbi:transmembrane protein [Cystoisospora suis]|uniref:Transmembrane protein n=1 Tax=Cystoisospora suis TaxID=483139 RepID=A0A2C6KZF8_9APIC|nr:transmembrane protein [Cystoisospora suis]